MFQVVLATMAIFMIFPLNPLLGNRSFYIQVGTTALLPGRSYIKLDFCLEMNTTKTALLIFNAENAKVDFDRQGIIKTHQSLFLLIGLSAP